MELRQFEDLGWGLGKKSEDVAFVCVCVCVCLCVCGEGGGGVVIPRWSLC